MEEIELTYIDIDTDKIERKLIALGAKKAGDYHYRRIVFDYPDFSLDKQAAWVRLRDEGDKITLAFKQRLGENVRDKLDGDDGMYERETFLKIGLIEKMYQENKRTRYILNG